MKKGFKMYKDTYAAIPYGNSGYIIIHNGQQLEKLCKTEDSARKYINAHRKSQSISQLLVDEYLGPPESVPLVDNEHP
jgi:hypothetical protein